MQIANKDVVGRNILRLLEERGMSQLDLARKAGFDNSNLSKLIHGKYPWNKGNLTRLAAVLKCETHDFFLDIDSELGFDPTSEVRITVYDVALSAGPGGEPVDDPSVRKQLTFTREWVRKLGAKVENLGIASVENDSMEPTLFDGDKVVVNKGDKNIDDGRVYAIRYHGKLRIKRLYRLPDGRVRISSDNRAKYEPEYLTPEQEESVEIIGRAVHRMGEGGL